MAKETKGFAELIEDAQRAPTGAVSAPAEVTSPFAMPVPPDHRVVNEVDPGKVPGAVEYDYEAHSEVLCLNQDEERARYAEILNDCLNAKAILRYEDRNWTKEGDAMVLICWMTRKPKPVRGKLQSIPSPTDD